MRKLVWFVGAVCLGYAAYRFAAWHLLFQMALLVALLLWAIVGLIAVSHKESKPTDAVALWRESSLARKAVLLRAEMVKRHGEDWVRKAEAEQMPLAEMIRGPHGSAK